jgi:hypothetical protein
LLALAPRHGFVPCTYALVGVPVLEPIENVLRISRDHTWLDTVIKLVVSPCACASFVVLGKK